MEKEKIIKEAEEIINKFSEILEKFDLEGEESYYIIDKKNVLREDEPKIDKEFREKFLKLSKSENGYIKVERAHWLK
ncbi:Asp-tRNA(Asn) amidotransferase subunit GatC [Methanocaldococcus indicus]|uniref:Asp-tRNA(Asn) amidotransferase subunit GatC n=1 Tax=Methanocaldococcus indicus TaxID=213231 RepID=UPI003C6CC582